MDNKKLYNRCKALSFMYNLPLYVVWKYRYFPQDLRYVKKYGSEV